MNIFIIDEDPRKAAVHMHDRHVIKMILESAQMLSTTRRWFGDENPILYKTCFINHPCTKWVRESTNNYIWLCKHFKALCEEYTYRYGRSHVCEKFIPLIGDELLNKMIDVERTHFALAMPEEYKVEDPVQSYRNYYIGKKIQNNFWTKRRFELDDWLLNSLDNTQFKERQEHVNRRTHSTGNDNT